MAEKSVSQKVPAKKQPRPKEPAPQEYRKFIDGLDMRDMLLLEGSAKRLAFPAPGATLGINVKALKPRCKRYPDGFTVTAIYEIQVTQQVNPEQADGAEQAEVFGTFRVGFEAVYASELPLTDAYFEVFKRLNLPLNVWPYVRQYVHQQSVLMGLPALVLPVHRTP